MILGRWCLIRPPMTHDQGWRRARLPPDRAPEPDIRNLIPTAPRVRFLYVEKKLPAGRLWPAAAVTPRSGQAPAARVPAGRGSNPLASVVTATRCATEPGNG